MDNIITYGSEELTDADIFGGVEYSKTINSNINLQPGDVAAAQIKFTIKDRLFDVDDELVYSIGSTVIGKFYVTDIQKGNTDYTITAYDAISKLDTDCFDFMESLTYPIQLKQIFTGAAYECGLDTTSADTGLNNMVNGSFQVYSNNFNQGTTFRQLFSYIAEANGCFMECQYARGTTQYYELLRVRKYGYDTASTVYISSNCKKLKEADYSCPHITRAWSGTSNDDTGTSSGVGDVVLKIYNNPFFYIEESGGTGVTEADVQTALSNILTVLPQTDYVPFTLTTFNENIALIAGQNVSVYGTVRPIFSISWNKSGFAIDSTGDPDREQENNYGFSEQKMNGAYNRLTRTLDGTISEVSKKVDGDQIISTINQSAEAVTINANKVNLTGYVTMSNLSTSGETVINGDNIQTGTIKLGGVNNTNGKLEVYNASSTKMGQWTNTGEIIWDDTTYANSQTGNATFKILRTGDAVDSHHGIFEGVTTTGSSTKYPFINLRSTDSSGNEGPATYLSAGEWRTTSMIDNGYSQTTRIADVQPSGIAINESIYSYGTTPTSQTIFRTNIEARPIDYGPNGQSVATLTKSSGAWGIISWYVYKWGNVVFLSINFNLPGGTSTWTGQDVWQGTLACSSQPILPIVDAMGTGFIGNSSTGMSTYTMWLQPNGTIDVRNYGSTTNNSGSGWPARMSLTYLTQDMTQQ